MVMSLFAYRREAADRGDGSATGQPWVPAFLLPVLLGLAAFSPAAIQAGEVMAGVPGSNAPAQLSRATGPTIRLDYERGKTAGNPIASFMYFVPLISPEPVSSVTSPENSQTAHVISAQRRFTAHAFTVKCDFEITGLGSQQSLFDLTNQIRRHERKLKAGGVMRRQLSSITVEGTGSGQVEVSGTVSNGLQMVTEVRLRFNARGKTSPVSIGLCDIQYREGDFQQLNEVVARVNTLTFRRKAGPPKMDVTVASVKKKDASENLWQSLKGSVKGLAVNLFIDPLTVEALGHQAMLDFGQALVSGAPTFTFPRARNLKSAGGR